MSNKLLKAGMLLIAAVMLVSIAFAGAASADPKIEITNNTGTYEINLTNPIIYGDSPATDGSVTYAEVDGMPVLTLHAFKASTTTNLPVIFANSDVLDLKIVLDGTSTLNSSKEGTANSAIHLEYINKDTGNLTITTIPGTPGKLIVNQSIDENANPIFVNRLIKIEGVDTTLETNAKSKDCAYSLISNRGIEIDGATVTAIADAASSSAEGLKTDYIRITNSAHVKVTATASGTVSGLYAQGTDGIAIDGDSEVNVYAKSSAGEAYGLRSKLGQISIADAETVNVNAISSSNTNAAYALYAKNNIDLTSSHFKATADAERDAYVMYTSSTDGDISIADSTIDELTATSNSGGTYPIKVDNGDLSITDSTHIGKVISHAGDNKNANGFWVKKCISITDSTIGEMNSTSDSGDAYVMYTASRDGDISITDSTIDELTATSNSGGSYPIYVDWGDLSITDSTHIGKVISHTGDFGYANGFWVNNCITITDSTIGEMNSTSDSGNAYVMYTSSTDGDISITDSTIGELTATSDSGYIYMINPCSGDLSITNSTIDELNVTSNSGGTYPIYVDNGDLLITDSSHIGKVISHGVNSEYVNGFLVKKCITITDSTIDEMNSTSDSGEVYVMYTSANNGDISVINSTLSELNATSNSANSYAIFPYEGDLIIGEGSIIRVKATGVDGYAMVGGYDFNMTNPTLVSAIGTTTSFAYFEELDIDSLEQDYSIVNATYPETAIGFTAFRDDWNYDKQIWGYTYYASNYTSVLIAKEVTVALDANGGEGGSASVNATYGCTSLNITNPTRSGYTLSGWFTEQTAGNKVVETNGDLVAGVSGYTSAEGTWINMKPTTLYAKWTQNSQPYTPSHRESGQTVIQQSPIQQEVSKDPTPANQATADISVKYVGQNIIGSSTSDMDTLKQQNPEAAAQMESAMSAAQAAGIPLTNSKGAKAIVVSDTAVPGVEKVTFSRVYEISPANEGEKLTKVTVKVPKSDITSKGLTSDDVTVYHFLEAYNIWQPLEIVGTTSDADNYYYTAATDGTSPFGVLVKKIGSDTATPTTQPTQTQKSPAPLAGIIAGLGAAALFLRLRR